MHPVCLSVGGRGPPSAESLVAEAMASFEKVEGALPCVRLALTAHEFSGLASGRSSIASFLCASAAPPLEVPCLEASSEKGDEGLGEMAEPSFELEINARGGAKNSSTGEEVGAADPQGGMKNRSLFPFVGGKDTARLHSGVRRTSPSLESGKEECPKCGEAFLSVDIREHLDFHYAEGLQQRYAREGDVARDMAELASAGGGAKRRRPEGGTVAQRQPAQARRSNTLSANRRIDYFFKPA